MAKWTYGLAVYQRAAKPCIETGNSILPMTGINQTKFISVDTFLKAAGEAGWELASTLVPFEKGKELGEDESDRTFRVEDPLDIQWLIFKRQR